MLMRLICLFSTLLVFGTVCAGLVSKPLLVINEDDSHYFFTMKEATRAELEKYVDDLAAGGAVTHFFMCPNAQRANFDSKVFEPSWTPREGVKLSSWGIGAKKLHDAGLDPYAIWADRCRRQGISPWLSMRMNDVHFCWKPDFVGHSRYWLDHPELRRDPKATEGDWGLAAFDYSHIEVRTCALAFIRELLDRYDVDGIECDWMRMPDHLTPGKEREQSPILNAFMREVRALAEAAAKRRGHPVLVGARVDSDPIAAESRGTDAIAWAREGSVDWVVPCNYFSSTDFSLPLETWKRKISEVNAKTKVIPGCDAGVVLNGTMKRRMMTASEYRGWASRMYEQGAEGLYLFNLFTHPPKTGIWEWVLGGGLEPTAVRMGEKSIPDARRECARRLR